MKGNKSRNSLNFRTVRGSILIIVLLIVPVIFLIAFTIQGRMISDLNFTNRDLTMKRAFYIAQAGERAALYEFSSTNYQKFTHDANGSAITGLNRTPVTIPGSSVDGEGWTVWEWNPGDPHKSFSGTGNREKYRYRIIQNGPLLWTVESQGYYGDYARDITVRGYTEGAFKYALFANESLSEFTRGPNQEVSGRIHSNGNMHFRPTGSTLSIYSSQVTSAGRMIRFEDAWGRPDRGGIVRIQNNGGNMVVMQGYSQGASGQGRAYDSYHADWLLDDLRGAMGRWNGRVMDGSLGAAAVTPPSLQSFAAGGYYNQQAGLVIGPTSTGPGITGKSFYNKAEGRMENVREIDLATFTYPSNGLVYASTPIRLVNGAKLPGPLTVVSNSNIYTLGDMNKQYPTKDAFDARRVEKVPFALMTSSRIYHLSSAFKDNQNNSANSSLKKGSDQRLYNGDETDVIEINGALVDGPPQVDEINYVRQWNGVNNPLYTGVDDSSRYTWANSDDFLEDLSDVTVHKYGSIVHLENAAMANLNNSNAGPGVTAWVYRTHYVPPHREYSYDPSLGNSGSQPPYFPVVIKILGWRLTK